jgi:hypothetical protein
MCQYCTGVALTAWSLLWTYKPQIARFCNKARRRLMS